MTDAALALAAWRGFSDPSCIVGRAGRIRISNRAWTAPSSPVTLLAGRSLAVGDDLPAILERSGRPGADVLARAVRTVLDRGEAELSLELPGPSGGAVRHRVLVSVVEGDDPGALITMREAGHEEAVGMAGDDEVGLFQRLLDSVSDGFYVADARSGRLEYVSAGLEEVVGVSRAELLRNPSSLLSAIHPMDRDRVRSNLWRQAEGTFDESYRVIHPGGSVRWVRARAFPLGPVEDGAPVQRIAGIVADITARRETEETLRRSGGRYRAIFESSAVGMALLGADASILEANAALRALLGWTEGMPATSLLELLEDPDREQVARRLPSLAENLEEGWTRETHLSRRGGGTAPVRLNIFGAHAADDPVVGILLVEDISERKRLEQQLQQAQRIESVGRLAGGIAHDFNNLVTVIRGHTDLLLDELDEDDPLRSDLEDIRAAGERAAALTGQLLAFSRRNVLQPRVLDLNRIVDDMKGILGRILGEDVRLRFEQAPDLGLVRADPAQMEQILLNLVVNARDAMPTGGELAIATFDRDLDDGFVDNHLGSVHGPHVAIRIADTGHGMAADTMALIFEPFFTTKEPGKGTGLGLAMTYGIVKQSGGYIDVESAPDDGATFTIYLPRVQNGDPPEDTETELPGDTEGTETILVAEDEPQVRALAQRILEGRGYSILTAETGRDALITARAHPGPIHLLVSDVVMPGMGGNELAERLQAERPALRVLFVSGYTDDAVVRHGVFEREMPFLGKPFTAEELAATVRRVLDGTD